LSLSSYAQVCNEVSLYKNGESGKMVQSTFPEAPEWNANWGELSQGGTEALTPPYIRWSGMKDMAGDWTGLLSLSNLPATVQGGNVNVKVRSTQKGKFGIWLAGAFGNSGIKFFELDANRSYSLNVPVDELMGNTSRSIEKIGIGLFDVPARQYTTLFIDDVSLSCAKTSEVETEADLFESLEYPFEDVDASSAFRKGKFIADSLPVTTPAYTDESRLKLKDSTQMNFVVNIDEFERISNYVNAEKMTPQQSRDGWFRSMYFIERNRLRDSLIANPKALFYEASSFAASTDNQLTPLLIGNVDFAYRTCADTSCAKTTILNSRALLAGLPIAWVNGARLKIFYDPYFVSTNRKNLPKVEIYSDGKWNVLNANSSMELDFASAGAQKIQVRLSEGNLTVNQNIYVEVR
jgi:hypothetical protein